MSSLERRVRRVERLLTQEQQDRKELLRVYRRIAGTLGIKQLRGKTLEQLHADLTAALRARKGTLPKRRPPPPRKQLTKAEQMKQSLEVLRAENERLGIKREFNWFPEYGEAGKKDAEAIIDGKVPEREAPAAVAVDPWEEGVGEPDAPELLEEYDTPGGGHVRVYRGIHPELADIEHGEQG